MDPCLAATHAALKACLPQYPHCTFLLAVSGGVDSMVLLHLMQRLISKDKIFIGHLDHRTRQGQSSEDALWLKELCSQKQLSFICEKIPVSGEGLGEVQLRNYRLEFLKRLRQEKNLDFILTGHHAQDQLETFFVNLIRGSGARGFSGMEVKRGIFLKPMLGLSRVQILNYARANEVSYKEDSSNLETKFFRNKIRQKLIPEIEEISQKYGGMQRVYSKLSRFQSELRYHLDHEKKELNIWKEQYLVETDFWLRFSQFSFEKLPEFLQYAVLQDCAERLGLKRLTRKQVAQVLLRMQSQETSFSFPKNIQGIFSYGQYYLLKKEQSPLLTQQDNFFHCSSLGLELHVDLPLRGEFRFFCPGDRYQNRKLKEVFEKRRIPRPERRLIPLFAKPKSQEVLWVFPDFHPEVRVCQSKFPFSFSPASTRPID